MKKKTVVPYLSLFFLLFQLNVIAGREYININKNWSFYFAYDVNKNAPKQNVVLPHTWNVKDVAAGLVDYYRTTGIYEHTIEAQPAWKDKRVFVYFEGANSVADVLLNNQFITQHKGGYTAFCSEITSFLKLGEENKITVQVSNAARTDVLPLTGDFNVYGGLHRSVWLIITDKNCITPLDYASPGVYINQTNISPATAQINVNTKLSLTTDANNLQLKTIVRDAQHKEVANSSSVINNGNLSISQSISFSNPHLWNGRKDPYLYTVIVQMLHNGDVIDEITQPLGLRNFRVDADAGFFLNGKYLDLYGFGFHEDVEGKGSAVSQSDLEKDMSLVVESGATALRLTHYPHSNYFYDLADKEGIVLWTEIPLVGPGGYTGTGFINSPLLKEHASQVLTELIRQQYNHPSVVFWGLFNELKLDYDDPIPFLKELQALAKKEDSSRIITCASFIDSDAFNDVSDVIGWNKYYGWYGGAFNDVAVWADAMHQKFPAKPISISEYGGGANILHHTEELKAPKPDGDFHPEEWQTAFHISHWSILRKRKFVWGKFVWALSDFGSSIRNEGGIPGINDKGLVTYDRNTKKDAFYFYKANWSNEPFIYLAEKRNFNRTKPEVTIQAFTNCAKAELFVNGKSFGFKQKDSIGCVVWTGVILKPGKNEIVVKSVNKNNIFSDKCEWDLAK